MCNVEIIDKIIDTIKIVDAQNKTQAECIKTLSKIVAVQTESIDALLKRVIKLEAGNLGARRHRS